MEIYQNESILENGDLTRQANHSMNINEMVFIMVILAFGLFSLYRLTAYANLIGLLLNGNSLNCHNFPPILFFLFYHSI
jgi:hypothetical protein